MIQINSEVGLTDYPLKIDSPFTNSWTNFDNAHFYENVPLKTFISFATLAGLDTHSDLQIIKPHLEKATAILEVGGGYGRVIDYLSKYKFPAKISTIERSQKFCTLLEKKFGDKVEIFNETMHSFRSKEKYDVILWLWEGIADFSFQEQPLILEKLISFLKKNGVLILDTLSPELITLNANHIQGKYNEIRAENLVMYIHTPSQKEIFLTTKKLRLNLKQLKYQTITQRMRTLYIFSR